VEGRQTADWKETSNERRGWEVWDEDRAKLYVLEYGTPQSPELKHADRMELAASLLEGESVLDVGCGIGHLLPWIGGSYSYLGLDNSKEMLHLAKELQPNGDFRMGDVYDLSPFGKFDSVVCQSLLIHLPEISKPIKNMWEHTVRVLIFSIPISRVLKTFNIKTYRCEKCGYVFRTARERKVCNKCGGGYLIVRGGTQTKMEKIIRGLEEVQEIKQTFIPGTRNAYFKIRRIKR